MDCKECKNKKENEYTVETARKAQPVEYFVHEGMMARMERTQKRIWVLCVIMITLLAASWVGFFVYESQYEDVSVSQDVDTGEGDAIIAGVGDVHYGEDTTNR